MYKVYFQPRNPIAGVSESVAEFPTAQAALECAESMVRSDEKVRIIDPNEGQISVEFLRVIVQTAQ